MNTRQKLICTLYALVAIVSLLGTLGQLAPYLPLGPIEGNTKFWADTLVNSASRFITVDIMFVFLVVWHWMLTEARRLSMRAYWLYLPASLLVAFSATLPIFMIHRELAKSRRGETDAGAGAAGWLSVAFVAAVALGYTWLSSQAH